MVAIGNVGLAFGLVIGSGAATTLGACIVFCTSLARPRLLAGRQLGLCGRRHAVSVIVAWLLQFAAQLQPSGRRGRCRRQRRLGWSPPQPPVARSNHRLPARAASLPA